MSKLQPTMLLIFPNHYSRKHYSARVKANGAKFSRFNTTVNYSRSCCRHLLILLLVSAPVVNVFATEQLPLEYFVKHGDFLDLKLSPDAAHMVARVRVGKKVAAVVFRRKDGVKVGGVQSATNDAIHDVSWASNDRLLYTVAEKKHWLDRPIETGELYAINVDGSQHELLVGYRAKDGVKADNEILSVLKHESKKVLILERPWDQEGHVYKRLGSKKPIISKLDIYTGKRRKLEVLPYPGAQAVANEQGDVNFMVWTGEDSLSHGGYRARNDSEWKTLTIDDKEAEALVPISVNKAGTSAYLSANTGARKTRSLFEIDVKSGKITPLLAFTHLGYDLEWYTKNPSDFTPAIGVTWPGKAKYHYLDDTTDFSKHNKQLLHAFNGQYVEIIDYSSDGKLVLVHVSSDVNPGEYYLFDTQTMRAELLLANRSWVDPAKMSIKRPISLPARDGLQLHGYLTLPATQSKTKSGENIKNPLIVLPHGGPHGVRDYWLFDPEVQLFSNRGYAVLQINFRGSAGYGEKFEEAGYREWGGKIIDDVIDATNWTIDRGYADADRICIYGASFGGYAAMMAAAKAPELFECAVGYAGIYNLEYRYSKGIIKDTFWGENYLERVLGDDKQQLNDYSPVNHADKINAAVMLIHGGRDDFVPIKHAKAMRKQLKKAGKTVEWLSFSTAGHGVWKQKNQVKMYSELLAFFDRHIGKK